MKIKILVTILNCLIIVNFLWCGVGEFHPSDAGGEDGGDGGNPDASPPFDAGLRRCTSNCPIEEMIEIPEGPFMMGCNEEIDTYCRDGIYPYNFDEKPYHRVTLLKYRIDKYEVTAGNYKKCVADGVCSAPDYRDNCSYFHSDSENNPSDCANWYQAFAYCYWVNKRLPTEAEWEKAARGTAGLLYPWGNSPEPDCDYAILPETGKDPQYFSGCGLRRTWPVGSRPNGKSYYGVEDMAGNAYEWVNDWYDKDYYSVSPGVDPQGPTDGSFKINRGSYYLSRYYFSSRTSNREYIEPDWSGSGSGFRCAISE